MKLLVTRPAVDAAPLARRLEADGYEVLIDPLLEIRVRLDANLDLDGIAALLFTSANGVRAFAELSQERDLPVFAVGERTAEVAGDFGFHTVETAEGDVEALAALVTARRKPEDGTLLHVRGTVVAGDLAGRLTEAGFIVRGAALYEARSANEFDPATVTALRNGTLQGVLLFSPRTARHFSALLRIGGMLPALSRVTAYCLSPAVAEALADLPLRGIHVAERPTQAALIETLKLAPPTMTAAAPVPAPPPAITAEPPAKKQSKPKPKPEQSSDDAQPSRKRGGRSRWLFLLGALVAIGVAVAATRSLWLPLVGPRIADLFDSVTPQSNTPPGPRMPSASETDNVTPPYLPLPGDQDRPRPAPAPATPPTPTPSAEPPKPAATAEPPKPPPVEAPKPAPAAAEAPKPAPEPPTPSADAPAAPERPKPVAEAAPAPQPAPAAPPVGEIPAAPSADLGRQIEQLRETAAPRDAVIALQRQLSETTQRLEAVAQRPAADPTQLAQVASELRKVSGELSQMTDRIGKVESRVDQKAAEVRNERTLVLAAGQIRDALTAAAPFEAPVAVIQAVAPDDPMLADPIKTLLPHARGGVASRLRLSEELAVLSAKIGTEPPPASEASFWDRLLDRLSRLVVVKRVDDGTPSPDAPPGPQHQLATAERALRLGDLPGAVQAVRELEGGAAELAKPWLQVATARLDCERAADALVAALTKRLQGGGN